MHARTVEVEEKGNWPKVLTDNKKKWGPQQIRTLEQREFNNGVVFAAQSRREPNDEGYRVKGPLRDSILTRHGVHDLFVPPPPVTSCARGNIVLSAV